jgi:hypothetical protein
MMDYATSLFQCHPKKLIIPEHKSSSMYHILRQLNLLHNIKFYSFRIQFANTTASTPVYPGLYKTKFNFLVNVNLCVCPLYTEVPIHLGLFQKGIIRSVL